MNQSDDGRSKRHNPDTEDFSAMFEASLKPGRHIEIGETIAARVAAITTDSVFFELGVRREGQAPIQEFIRNGQVTVQEGESVDVIITGYRDGIFQCSRRPGAAPMNEKQLQQQQSLSILHQAFQSGLEVEGKVKAVIKGGFEVTVMGQRAFCPFSRIARKFEETPERHVNQTYAFLISEFAENGRNIVLDRRELLKREEEKRAAELWSQVAAGQRYHGTVTAVQEYGAFVDIGGLEGLVHISEISYERHTDARKLLTPGQELEVAVKEVDAEKRKLSLSLKALTDDPWEEAVKILSAGGEFHGKVVRIKPFGAFVQLFPGIDGMVHISRLGGNRRVSHPKEVLKVGDEVTVRVLEIDDEKRTIALTMEEAELDYQADLERLRREQKEQAGKTSANPFDALDTPGKKG